MHENKQPEWPSKYGVELIEPNGACKDYPHKMCLEVRNSLSHYRRRYGMKFTSKVMLDEGKWVLRIWRHK